MPRRCANIPRLDQTEKESSMNNSKACSKCKQILPLSNFGNDSQTKSGLRYRCKNCENKYSRDYKKANKRKSLDSYHRWYLRNKEYKAHYNKCYRESNRMVYRLADQRRRELLKVNSCIITDKEIIKLLSKPCFYCQDTGRITIDHIVPLSRGGRHSIGNLLPACVSCNSSKRQRFITEWKKAKSAK